MQIDPKLTEQPPSPADAVPKFTLIARDTAIWVFVLIAASVALTWVTESQWGQMAFSDTVGYPLMMCCFLGLAALVWRKPRHLMLAQGLASLALGVYFVGSMNYQLLVAHPISVYYTASLLYWLVAAYLLFFATWPVFRALALSLGMLVFAMLPAVIVHMSGPASSEWERTLWPLCVNGFFSQLFVVGAMFGITYQLRRLAVFTPIADAQLTDGDGEPLTVNDLVSRRTLDLEAARDQAEQASEAKSRFLAVMSHELRTPLHGVLGAADLMRDPHLSDASRRELLETVRRGGTHLLRLINDVLDVSRIEAGRLELAEQPFSLRNCIEQVMETIVPQAEGKGLKCELHTHGDVPPWIRGDEFRLKQVLLNLLGNAVKFTDKGLVSLALRCDTVRKQLHIEIEDTGIGIAPSQQGLVFDAFHQADGGVTRRHAGTGLGLSISKQLVTLMKGTLGLQSEPGRGTHVELRLPMQVCEPPAILPPASDHQPLGHALAGLRVLLVDDDPINTMIAEQMLQTADIVVHTATSGLDALHQLTRGGFDLVLMDWRMPDMDGLEATRRLRAGEAGSPSRDVPVVGLTANAYAEDRAACLEAGMNEVLVKPVGRVQLLQTIQQVLNAHAMA